MLVPALFACLYVAAAQETHSDVTPVTVPLSLGIGVFGAIFSTAGLCICASYWRRHLIRTQLMGAAGVATTTGTITSKRFKTSHGDGGSSTTYFASYNFTASVDGNAMQIYVKSSVIDGRAWQHFAPPCAATVRFLEREPRRCVLEHAAEIEMRQKCTLIGITCFASVFILVGAAISLGMSIGLGADAAAKAAGAGIFVVLIGTVLVFVCRAFSMNVHAVICCLSGVAGWTEFSNITVSALPQVQAMPAVAMAHPAVAHAAPMASPV